MSSHFTEQTVHACFTVQPQPVVFVSIIIIVIIISVIIVISGDNDKFLDVSPHTSLQVYLFS